jgi:hypothetical protein
MKKSHFFYPTIKFQDLLVSTKKLGEIQNKDMKGKFKMREAFSFCEKCQKKVVHAERKPVSTDFFQE